MNFLGQQVKGQGYSLHRQRKLSKRVWAMASAVARAYNGALGGGAPSWVLGGGQGAKPP